MTNRTADGVEAWVDGYQNTWDAVLRLPDGEEHRVTVSSFDEAHAFVRGAMWALNRAAKTTRG